MTTEEKLAAILAAVQIDPGNRGLARVPGDNLFTATAGDFQKACASLAFHPSPVVFLTTGFYIAGGNPPAFETDGPLGVVFLQRALSALDCCSVPEIEAEVAPALNAASRFCNLPAHDVGPEGWSHLIAIERSGPNASGRHYSMRGRDVTEFYDSRLTARLHQLPGRVSIGIGDGGNEIGMGKIPHQTIVNNIPNGDLIHCAITTDHLIVAGVSNWGAYALAAGLFVLRGTMPPADLFDPETELRILEVMVNDGPLVDGVTGQQTATVDGLSWEEYIRPLVQIREILNS